MQTMHWIGSPDQLVGHTCVIFNYLSIKYNWIVSTDKDLPIMSDKYRCEGTTTICDSDTGEVLS